MSLQVWLPLNGNLKNQGLSNVTVTNNGATVNDNGKIGKCYSFNGTDSYLISDSTFLNNDTEDFSYACWFKPNTATSMCLLSNRTSTANTGILIVFTDTTLIFDDGERWRSSVSVELNQWSHLVFIRKKDGFKKIYLNGTEVASTTSTGTLSTADSSIFAIGGSQKSSTNINSNYLNGYLNDVRVYDHCLSAKEVEEIAKGLVLHYPLNDRFCEATTNLVTSITAGSQTTVANNIITTSGQNKDTYFTLNLSENITNGTQYTIQCIAEMPVGTTWTFPIGSQSNSTLSWVLKPGYNEYTFTANDISWGNNQIFLDDLSGSARSSGIQCKFYNFQVEKKDHATGFAGYGVTRAAGAIYDTSGYGNNGIITGSLTTSTPSPRYSCATYFNGTNTFIEAESLPIETKTISAWIKWNNIPASAPYSIPIHDKNSGLAIGAYENGNKLICYVGPAVGGTGSCISCSLTINNWYHIVVVKTGDTTRDVYINSVKAIPTSNNWWGGDLNKLNIGCRHISGNYAGYFNGSISDFRAYAIALTAKQVADLYHTSMTIDNQGNTHARELVE